MPNSDFTINAYSLDRETAHRLLASQGEREFIRDVSEQTETVSYPPGSTVRFWYNNKMEAYPAHKHTAFELILPVEGSYLAEVKGVTRELAPGDILLIPGNTLHALRAPSRGSRVILLFEMERVLAAVGMDALRRHLSEPILINRSTCPGIYDAQLGIIDDIIREHLKEDEMRELSLYLALLTFFLNYCRSSLPQKIRESDVYGVSRNSAEKFQAVLAYIDRHFDENLTLEHAADVAGFSKYHFCRLFRQHCGSNFSDYLCRRRIRAAEELLTRSELSVSQIALQSGFSSIATFNRTFLKMNGCTPTQYRTQARVDRESNSSGG